MRISILFFVLGSAILSITGCNKDPINTYNSVPHETLRVHLPPTANAGGKIFVFLPVDSCILSGSVSYDPYTTIKRHIWRKISGPISYKINTPESSWTRVSDLIKGVYEFELTVMDVQGLTDVDTMSVTVGEMSAREVFFKNVRWGYTGASWGNALTVENIYSFIPVGSVFKVFVSSHRSGGWVEAIGHWLPAIETAQYILNIYNSEIRIYAEYQESDVAEIKIVY